MTAILVTKKNIVSLLLLPFFTMNIQAQEKLYVFYPSTVLSQPMQEKMTAVMQEEVCITVFDRYNNFIRALKTDSPDAIITKTILIDSQISGYEILLNGERNGKTEEKYVIVTIDNPLQLKSITGETIIGVIDILGRTGMKSFLKDFFPVEPKLQRVSKVEDLLPMLSFNMAAGIMIEDVFVDYFTSTSQLRFSVVPLADSKNGIIAFAIRKSANAEKTLGCLKRNDKALCDLFYIERWK